MSNPPWTIQRAKRKTPVAAQSSRKRVRISDDVDPTPRSTLLRKQSTLTQLDFVNSPHPDETGLDLDTINTDHNGKSGGRQRRKKRESTLTQMPWLIKPVEQENDFDDTLLSTQATTVEDKHTAHQMDGAYDSPRKPRVKHTEPSWASAASVLPTNEDSENIQDQTPAKKQKRASHVSSVGPSPARRSGRIASKHKIDSKSSANASHRNAKTLTTNTSAITNEHISSTRPVLEIKESMDFEDEESPMETRRAHRIIRPQTPRREYVASSQTPESRPQTQGRKRIRDPASPSAGRARKPLQERSTNLPPTRQKQNRDQEKPTPGPHNPAKRIKICTLKVPSRNVLRRSARVDGPQKDIFSLQSSSSPYRRGKVSSPAVTVEDTTHSQGTETLPVHASPEVNGIRSSPPTVDTQETLPSLTDLLGARVQSEGEDMLKTQPTHFQAATDEAVAVHDFYRERRSGSPPLDPPVNEVFVELQMERPLTPTGAADADGDSELGSPIANDTQFNIDLHQRTSSPATRPRASATSAQSTDQMSGASTPTQPSNLAETISQKSDPGLLVKQLLPTPKLVSSSAPFPATASRIGEGKRSRDVSTTPTGRRFMSRLPQSKDTSHEVDNGSSSSPGLPAMLPPSRPATQIARPAALPRPSQMSTQDPTQGYFPFSILHDAYSQAKTDVERITIKDSSSQLKRLSQFPEYKAESQKHGLGVDVIEDSEEEIDDLDLDNDNTKAQHSARKSFISSRGKLGVKSEKSSLIRSSSGLQKLDLDPSSDIGPSVRRPLPQQLNRYESSLKSIEAPRAPSPARVTLSSSPHHLLELEIQPTDEADEPDTSISTIRNDLPEVATRPSLNENVSINDKNLLELLDEISSSSSELVPLQREHAPIPGFDNDTQSNYTQGGGITAAYIHRMHENGWPEWFVPLSRKPDD